MVHLRPGEVNDRRRRTDPTWLASDQLHICALGRTSVERAGVSLDGDWLQQRPGQVLKYLICERNRPVSSEAIADAIWPMSQNSGGVGRVRHYVHAVRDRLEPDREKHSPSGYIIARNRGYALAHERLTVDVDRFESHASEGREALDAGSLAVARRHLEQANALYRGEFLADEPFADWASAERERLHDIATGVLRDLSDIAIREGQLARAAGYLNRLATLQPFDVQVHREVIAMCLRRGRKSEAMRRYSALKARMQRQFEEELDFTVADIQDALDSPPRVA
jgi:DNA-binding SARP family transcriptional activator